MAEQRKVFFIFNAIAYWAQKIFSIAKVMFELMKIQFAEFNIEVVLFYKSQSKCVQFDKTYL